MQRGLRPLHQPIIQPDEPAQASTVSAILSKLGLTREVDEADSQPDQERAPASAVNAIMGRLGLARTESEPEADAAELARGLTDPAWAVRVATVQKLGHIGKYAPLELLLVALRDDQSSVRIAAARALSRNPRQAALPALIATLTDSEWVVRTEVVRALGKLSDSESLAALLVAARDTDASVRSAVLLALGETGATEALELLNAALQDEDWEVREAATLALAQFVQPVVIPSLLNARLDQDPSIRSAAEAGLQHLYPNIAAIPPPPSDSFAQWLARIETPQTVQATIHQPTELDGGGVDGVQNMPGTPTKRNVFPWFPGHRDASKPHLGNDAGRSPFLRRANGLNFVRLAEVLVTALIFAGLIFTWLILANRPNVVPVRQNAPSAFTVYRGHTSSVEKLAWSPDGRSMASADSRGMVRIWQVGSGRTIAKYMQTGKVLALNWSDASTLLVAYGVPNRSLQVQQLSVDTTPLVQTIFQRVNLSGTPVAAAWSPDGSTLAFDTGQGEVQLWLVNAVAHQYLLTLSVTSLNQLAWSPDGSQISTISTPGLLQIWNASTGEIVATLVSGQQVSSAAWISCGLDSHGLIFAHPQDTFMKWCPGHKDKAPTLFLSAQKYNLKNSSNLSVGAIAISANSNQILLATSDGLVQARDATSGNLIDVYAGHSAQVNALTWSPNGLSIATASMDTTVQIWQET